jgi:hypothetical protein
LLSLKTADHCLAPSAGLVVPLVTPPGAGFLWNCGLQDVMKVPAKIVAIRNIRIFFIALGFGS